MRTPFRLPRPALFALAVALALTSGIYAVLWMYYTRMGERADLGIRYQQDTAQPYIEVSRVMPGTAADRAGIRPGDRIVAVNDRPMRNWGPYFDAVSRGTAGDRVRLLLSRPGAVPRTVEAVLGVPPLPDYLGNLTPAKLIVLNSLLLFPVPFLAVGFAVLFLRIEDPHAWVLALVFCCFIAQPFVPGMEGVVAPQARGLVIGYTVLFQRMLFPLFYFFFAVFPAPSPIERRLPALKWILLAGAGALAFPTAAACVADGSLRPANGARGTGVHLAMLVLGLISLVWNAGAAESADAKRKSRILAWGTVAAVTPFLLLALWLAVVRPPGDLNFREYIPRWIPFWFWIMTPLGLLLFPLSFGYAVLKHRVVDLPVLLRRSARYMLVQRGAVAMLICGSAIATIAVAAELTRAFRGQEALAVVAGVGFGSTLAWAGAAVHRRMSSHIDRVFFRNAYDSRQILNQLAGRVLRLSDRGELASALHGDLDAALHPATLSVYLEGPDGCLRDGAETAYGLGDVAPAVVAGLKEAAGPWRVPADLRRENAGMPAELQPEYLVPMQARDGSLIGVVALGRRLSEEPYSSEDKHLLAEVTGHAAVALETIRMGEKIAAHLESERFAAREMEIATAVQKKLLPQSRPALASLSCAGACEPARSIGGDYYDFLDLGSGKTALLLGDISGKGISAALLMANLQACTRSLAAHAAANLPGLLASVNRLLYDSTEPRHFATLFAAIYDDGSRTLTYANCGHNPPLLVRADGTVERLPATATVVGAFPKWQCETRTVSIGAGDLLAVFSDGVVEAQDAAGRDFGEERLLELLLAERGQPVAAQIDRVLRAVEEHTHGPQQDDITLVLARGL